MNAPVTISVPVEVVAEVTAMRSCGLRAQFKLDDSGFECLLLNDIADATNTLLAEWAGRRRPDTTAKPRIEETPLYINAAIEWRAERVRKERRR